MDCHVLSHGADSWTANRRAAIPPRAPVAQAFRSTILVYISVCSTVLRRCGVCAHLRSARPVGTQGDVATEHGECEERSTWRARTSPTSGSLLTRHNTSEEDEASVGTLGPILATCLSSNFQRIHGTSNGGVLRRISSSLRHAHRPWWTGSLRSTNRDPHVCAVPIAHLYHVPLSTISIQIRHNGNVPSKPRRMAPHHCHVPLPQHLGATG